MARARSLSSLLGILILLLACNGKQETYEPSSSEEQGNIEKGDTKPSNTASPVEETISIRLDRVIEKANTTHASLLSFTDSIFNDALRQGSILSCSAYRILMLTGRRQLQQNEIAEFRYRLSTLVASSNFIAFGGDYDEIEITVPPAVSYERSLSRKIKDLDYKSYDSWSLRSCGEEFKAPVPNGERARNEERQRFAQMIVRARLRLEYYERLLPEIEVKASRALSLKASLEAAKGDLSIDLNPEMADVKVREYEDFLNAATEALSQWRKEAALENLARCRAQTLVAARERSHSGCGRLALR